MLYAFIVEGTDYFILYAYLSIFFMFFPNKISGYLPIIGTQILKNELYHLKTLNVFDYCSMPCFDEIPVLLYTYK